jgi:hypothetical protein
MGTHVHTNDILTLAIRRHFNPGQDYLAQAEAGSNDEVIDQHHDAKGMQTAIRINGTVLLSHS